MSKQELKTGGTKSCGCLSRQTFREGNCSTIHGQANKTGCYRSWKKARERCRDVNNNSYEYYGGRGIEFRFASFEEFYAELGDRPEGMTLDRKDPDGHYEKGNVRWATPLLQRHNQRRSKYPN